VRSALAPYKAPRHVRLVDAVPRAANGKVDYGAAAALAAPGEADA
jgi:acyl-CoA synthetase (AMP-forming)/AMP-acid ligase II